MAARRTLAAGSARATQPRIVFSLGSDRSLDPAAALKVDAAWRDLSGPEAIAERQSAGVAIIADGPHRAGVSGLSEFRGLHRVEQLADLFDHRRLSRHPHRRQPADAAPDRAGCAIAVRRAPRIACHRAALRADPV